MNENVYLACCRLFLELEVQNHLDCHYAMPYANYIMLWPFHVPINTIIIGQSPYPQQIHCEFGAAFSYDRQKAHAPPRTVQVLAHDVHNFDGTDFDVAIQCFRDSWMLLEQGIIMINETVFHRLLRSSNNTRSIKETEAQIRALHVLISESFAAGQKSITCIGMGMPAACMTSILRSWCPKDLVQIRVMTCKNPAARDIGDSGSQTITLGKPAVSKVLSRVVDLFSRMSQPKQTQADKRRQQNLDAFKTRSNEITLTGNVYSRELQTLEERIKSVSDSPDGRISVGELTESCASLRRAIDSHANALSGHSITLIMLIDSLPKNYTGSDSSKRTDTIQSPSSSLGVPARPRRRIVRSPTHTMDSVVESIEQEPLVATTPTPSATPSRARRRVVASQKYTPSDVGTEYTVETSTEANAEKDIEVTERTHIQSFANWCSQHIPQDPVFSEILNTAAEERTIVSELTRLVVMYIRQRKSSDPEYDAYDELTDPDSQSTKWATENIVAQK